MESPNIEIIYNSLYGGFTIPEQLFPYLGIIENDDNYDHYDHNENWKRRTNIAFINLIKSVKNIKKDKNDKLIDIFKKIDELLINTCGIEKNNKKLREIEKRLSAMSVTSIDKEAYDCGAISYREYDGIEKIQVDVYKLKIVSTRKSLEKYLENNKDLSEQQYLEITKIIETLPKSYKLPSLAW